MNVLHNLGVKTPKECVETFRCELSVEISKAPSSFQEQLKTPPHTEGCPITPLTKRRGRAPVVQGHLEERKVQALPPPGTSVALGAALRPPTPPVPGKDSLLEDWNHPHGPARGPSENALHTQNQEPRGRVGTGLWASMEDRPRRFSSSRTFQSLS